MAKSIIFIHGGGDNGFKADKKLASSLQKELGNTYKVNYPKMSSDESLADFGWPEQIGKEINALNGEVALVGHSLGASMLLKYLTETEVNKAISGIFLIATPFWSGNENWVQGLKLKHGFEDKIPDNIPLYLYHSRDDREVAVNHLAQYSQKLSNAEVREVKSGGHQLNNNLKIVAKDIKSIW